MAKHLVKCYFCGEQFDANTEPYVKVNGRRYAHKYCSEHKEKVISQEELDKLALFEYIKEIYGKDYNYVMINKQIEKFHQEGYSYNGMKLSLKWFYEVKGNSPKDSNGGVGIIPYVFEDAKKYYYAIYLAKMSNQGIKNYKPTVREISVPSPKIYRRPPQLFNLEGDSE